MTSLVTEAVKKFLDSCNAKYNSNIVAGIVSAVLSAALGVGYVIFMSFGFTAQIIVCIIGMTFLGWLGAMIGYDKVISVLKNFKKGGKNE